MSIHIRKLISPREAILYMCLKFKQCTVLVQSGAVLR